MATLRQLLLVRRPPATSAIRRQLSPAAARWRLAASAGGYNVRMDMQSLVAPIRRPLFRAGGLRPTFTGAAGRAHARGMMWKDVSRTATLGSKSRWSGAVVRGRQRCPYRARTDCDLVRDLLRQARERNPRDRRDHAVRAHGTARASHSAALEWIPLDGRTHQIRCADPDGGRGLAISVMRCATRRVPFQPASCRRW